MSSSTPRKYLSLEEAADRLGVSRDELVRMREHGEVRGFADRGTWKFRVEDVDELARSRQVDSSPDVPLIAEQSDPLIVVGGDSEEATVVRQKGDSSVKKESDSDVRLAGDSARGLSGGSDSDVRLVSGADRQADSDSDVKLVGDSSELPAAAPQSDSDVRLVPEPTGKGSDSDVQLIESEKAADDSSDSDVALIGASDSAVALEPAADAGRRASGRPGESSAASDSGITLQSDSGISLESDSGIALKTDSGITLEGAGTGLAPSESGISLEAVGDSGISLEDSEELQRGTVPMMDAVGKAEGVQETRFEIPSLGDDDSAFDLESADDSGEQTGLLDMDDMEQTTALDDAVFEIDEDAGASGEELEVAEDILGEDDELEELDVFDADEGLFEESGASQEFAAPIAGRGMLVEQEWSGGLVAALAGSSALLLLATIVSFDLVRSMWAWNEATPISSMLLQLFGGR